jgi:hypothetical protein
MRLPSGSRLPLSESVIREAAAQVFGQEVDIVFE